MAIFIFILRLSTSLNVVKKEKGLNQIAKNQPKNIFSATAMVDPGRQSSQLMPRLHMAQDREGIYPIRE